MSHGRVGDGCSSPWGNGAFVSSHSRIVTPSIRKASTSSNGLRHSTFVHAKSAFPQRVEHKPTCLSPARQLIRSGYEVKPGYEWLTKTIGTPPRIALTRESGKNDGLRDMLEMVYDFSEILELPCVETVEIPDGLAALTSAIGSDKRWDWMIVTSPEGAKRLIQAWRHAACPKMECGIAAVGKATGDVIRAVGLEVSFEPSKATGRTLVQELPCKHGERALYTTSGLASQDVEEGLSSRGISVVRIDAYTTRLAKWDASELALGRGCHIVTFASPSAVNGWVDNVGVEECAGMIAACIGQTSAKRAREKGFEQVVHGTQPGLEGWTEAVLQGMKEHIAKGGNDGNSVDG